MEGYPKLAQLMGNDHTDGHFLIFQKFEQLSARDLLYHQAEIINLQEDLSKSMKEDAESDGSDRQLCAKDWLELSSSKDSEQWEIWLEIRAKLKQYYKAIDRHRMISNIPYPDQQDLRFLQKWLERPSMGNCSFVGADRNVYDDENAAGLGALASRNEDILTRGLLYLFPRWYHGIFVTPFHHLFGRWIKKPENLPGTTTTDGSSQVSSSEMTNTLTANSDAGKDNTSSPELALSDSEESSPSSVFDLESNVFLYRDSYFYRIGNILGTLISTLIPIGAIVVLYLVSDMGTRLAIVSLFTALFSVTLSLVTGARRVEIFAATAAFASVQVVFVGSTKSTST